MLVEAKGKLLVQSCFHKADEYPKEPRFEYLPVSEYQ